MLSGALLDPRSLRELVPDFKEKGAPLAAEVHEDRIYFLTEHNRFKFPITPPPFANHGNYVMSLNKLVKWLASLVEAEGIDLFTGFLRRRCCSTGTAWPGFARAIAASASTARRRGRSSRGWTSRRRSRSSRRASAATSRRRSSAG